MRVTVWFLNVDCWSCGDVYIAWQSDEGDRFHPAIVAAAGEVVKKYGGVLAVIKERYSKTVDQAYMSFGCPSCDALCG